MTWRWKRPSGHVTASARLGSHADRVQGRVELTARRPGHPRPVPSGATSSGMGLARAGNGPEGTFIPRRSACREGLGTGSWLPGGGAHRKEHSFRGGLHVERAPAPAAGSREAERTGRNRHSAAGALGPRHGRNNHSAATGSPGGVRSLDVAGRAGLGPAETWLGWLNALDGASRRPPTRAGPGAAGPGRWRSHPRPVREQRAHPEAACRV